MNDVNLGGVFIPGQPIGGTYSVNPDCAGTTTMTIAGEDQSWHFVILQDADQVAFIGTPSGLVWSGADSPGAGSSLRRSLACFSTAAQ